MTVIEVMKSLVESVMTLKVAIFIDFEVDEVGVLPGLEEPLLELVEYFTKSKMKSSPEKNLPRNKFLPLRIHPDGCKSEAHT